MKKSLLFLSILVLGLSYSPHAQTINLNKFDSCSISGTPGLGFTLAGFVTGASSGMYINISWGDGNNTNNVPVSSIGNHTFYANHFYSVVGLYTYKVVLYDTLNTPLDSVSNVVNSNCKAIHGTTYIRNDNDCVQSGTEPNVPIYTRIAVERNNTPLDTFYSYGSFMKGMVSQAAGDVFKLTLLDTPAFLDLVCPDVPMEFTMDTTVYNDEMFKIGFECNSLAGFDLYTYATGLFRPVNNSYMTIIAGNYHCDIQASATLTLELSPKYSFVSASLPPASVSGQTITWNLTNISLFTTTGIGVVLSPVGTINLGDTVCNVLTIEPATGDVNPVNNVFNQCDTVRASWDPNNKIATPPGEIAVGTNIVYTVNFENLGNDTAFNIYVLDTLAAELDFNSLQILYSTHEMTVQSNKLDDGRVQMRFEFSDIKLGDKDDTLHNKGSFMYSINVRGDLAPGTIIPNTAHIFFDANPAIVTNTAINKIPDPISVNDHTRKSKLQVYPNPAQEHFVIVNNSGKAFNVDMHNLLGQKIKTISVKEGNNFIDTKAMAGGVYYLVPADNAVYNAAKVVIQK